MRQRGAATLWGKAGCAWEVERQCCGCRGWGRPNQPARYRTSLLSAVINPCGLGCRPQALQRRLQLGKIADDENLQAAQVVGPEKAGALRRKDGPRVGGSP